MRATVTEIFHVFLSFPFVAFLALAAVAVHARRHRDSRLHRWRNALAAVAAAFYLLTLPIGPAFLEQWLEHLHPVPQVSAADRAPDNVILVLTGGWLRWTPHGYEQKLGEAGWERTAAAVDLWHRVGGRVLFTGAPTPDGKDSAAAAMARIAAAMGVPPDALLVEPAALNTHENLLYSMRLLGPKHGRVWLLTSALHMPRSVMAADALGIAVTPYPCDFRADERVGSWTQFVPSNSARPALERALHEVAGMAAYWIRGWG